MKTKLFFITFILMATGFQLNAQSITWDGGASTTTWSDAENWTGDVVPAAGDDVYIDDATVVLTESTTIQRVFVDGSSNLTINSSQTLTITGFAGSDDGLELNNSAIVVNNGTIAISDIHIADTNADGIYNRGTITNNGAITIDGTGQYGIYMQRGTFTNSVTGTLTIANYGQGDTAADGLYLDDSSGTLSTFNNFGSINITMPGSDDGIYVNDGSEFNNSGMITVGGSAGDNGIRIDDSVFNNNSGATFTINATPNDQLYLDNTSSFNNSGTVNLNNSGDIGLYVIDNSVFTNNSDGTVTVTDSTDHSLQVDANSLTANISNSGTITTQNGSQDGLRLQEAGSFTNNVGGNLNINQSPAEGIRLDATAGTLTNSGTITITGSGSGVAPGDNGIEVSGGNLTNATGATLTITNIFDKGILTTGGIINNTGTIDISNTGEEGMDMNSGGTFNNNNGGIFKVVDGAEDALEINTGCTVINDGDMQLTFTTDGSGRDDIEFNGGTFTNNSNATFNPGNTGAYGELEFRGNIDLGMSITTFDISGSSHTTEFDRIDFPSSGSSITVTNATAHLNWGSYVPNIGDTFKIVDGSATVTGTFSSVTTSNSDIVTALNYSANEVQVEVTDINSTWTGGIDNDWDTAGNWSTIVPISTTNVTIPSGLTNYPTASVAVTTNGITMASGASFIANSSVTGDITYNLSIPDANWHLVSSPVNGETYDDAWVAANSIATGSVTTNRGIATYQNGTPDATTGPWTYMQGGSSGTFGSGTGYSMIATGATTYGFTGAYPTLPNSRTITQDVNNWNLVGNPATAYIDVAAYITANTANLEGAFQALYVYNGSTYTGLTSGYIHPGQAFFVSSNIASGTLSTTAAMLSHQTGVTFYKSGNTSINLSITDGNLSSNTSIEYMDNSSLGLDPGKDLGKFNGVNSSLNIYTNLIENNEGIAFEKQTIPSSAIETIEIPVGVKAMAGKEITISASSINLPEGINVFLEDRELNEFSNLNDANYKIVLDKELNGEGRFYLHTSSKSALTVDDNLVLNNISIYKANESTLRIVGLQQGKASFKLYNVLGKQIITSSFEANGVKDITLPNLSKGVYIVQLETASGNLNKKIVLE